MGERIVGENQIVLTCDMVEGCEAPITHIDIKGYIYCAKHGQERRSYQRCRKLTRAELVRLQTGTPLESY